MEFDVNLVVYMCTVYMYMTNAVYICVPRQGGGCTFIEL